MNIHWVPAMSQALYVGIVEGMRVTITQSYDKGKNMWKLLSCVRLFVTLNSPGQNTGVGSLSLLQGIFPTQGLNPGLPHCRCFFTSWATREAKEYWSG